MKESLLEKEFDPDLWKGGVEDGAFSGDRDPDSIWYTLKVGGHKVALASTVPGPGDLTTVSYFVHPDHRGNGYGTKIASGVTDLHEKATFTIFKDNEASIKVAIAALKEKFSMTMGHNVVRLTKEAVDPLLLGAFGAAGVLGGILGTKLGQRIRAALAKRKLAVPKEALHLMDPEDVEILKEKFEVNIKVSRDLLKQAVTRRGITLLTRSRQLAHGAKPPSEYRIREVAKALARQSPKPVASAEKPALKGMFQFGTRGMARKAQEERVIRKRIIEQMGPQEKLF